MKKIIFFAAAVAVVAVVIVWGYRSIDLAPQTKKVTEATRVESVEKSFSAQPRVAQEREVNSSAGAERVSAKEITNLWMEGLQNTPPPRGTKWQKIPPRPTGERGCTPGETRWNPRTGTFQGCR